MIVNIQNEQEKKLISGTILSGLPDWFGIPESIADYVNYSKDMPFWAKIKDERAIGFIVLKENSSCTAEIYVMGVLEEYHREGIGRQLFQSLFDYAKEHNYEFLQVKTVKEGIYEDYDKTNNFYKSMGFKEFECFPALWDEKNPCQILVMAL